MKKFEYKILNFNYRFNLPQMNELGLNGWELVNLVQNPNMGAFTGVFKRELEDNNNDVWNYCSEVKPSGYDDALPKYFQVAVKYLIASGTQTVTDIIQACYFQENDKWYIHENDTEPLYGEVYAWRELPNKPSIK